MQYTYVLFFTFVLCPAVLRGMPSGPVDPANPAAVAAEPAVVAAPSVPATAPVQQTPVVSAPAPIQASEPAATGGGIVTEHKNPDGSTITVTRYNGPIPSSAFQSPLGSGLAVLHDAYIQNNLLQTEFLRLQAQQTINQMLFRNYPIFSYNPVFAYSPFTSLSFPYRYSVASAPGQFLSPFAPFGFGYNPFFSYPAQPGRSIK